MEHNIGIDIGTTNISVVLLGNNKKIIDIVSEKNNTKIEEDSFASLQDPLLIEKTVTNLLSQIINKHSNISINGIGIANQMHGILYVNQSGEAISSFYNWQDKRGDELFCSTTFSEYITQTTQDKVSTGYGLVTHFYNQHFNRIPQGTYKILDIGSYVISALTKKSADAVYIHPSNAQSWGLYDDTQQAFKHNEISSLSIDTSLLPQIKESNIPIGYYNDIPMYQSLGDNQAGYLSLAGEDEETVLINIGTSAQLSLLSNTEITALEKRPFINNKNIYVASSLCGGKTIDIWVHFLKDIIQTFDCSNRKEPELINKIYHHIAHMDYIDVDIKVSPYLYGSRSTLSQRASIQDITINNFDFEKITIGMVNGIVDELYHLWSKIPLKIRKTKKNVMLIGGGAKINLFFKCIKNKFDTMKVITTETSESVAIGAALWVYYLQNKGD